mmetsp:Transcript_25585/g.38262  ORF Transcript_25585/g.38262 Transcript_25585/m.38262 type:complete len:817 (-) Transcript_25585:179-2629(-)
MSKRLEVVKTDRFSVLEVADTATAVATATANADAADAITAAPAPPDDSNNANANTNANVNATAGQEQEQKQSKKKKKKKGNSNKDSNAAAAPAAPPREWTPELEADLQRILTVGEECISSSELKALLLAKGRGSESAAGINLYDGFEPSGRMHIAQGVFKAMNVNKCTLEGTNSKFIFWVADWFALMNDKMGGDLDKIKTVGHYLIEVWKAAGMNLDHVEFKWASEEITDKAHIYWPIMLDVAKSFNTTRIKKCCQIMGRLEGSLTAAQVLYPLMQCTDVFFLKADICQLGVDQRKVNMLAREYCDAARIKRKPVILSHHMLYGLKAGQEKMSKSDPDSAVFMEDTAEDVERKIMKAYCPNKEEEQSGEAKEETQDAGKESMHLVKDTLKNPVLDYIENIILSPPDATFTVNGSTYKEFHLIRSAFLAGEITEDQLKKGLVQELNKLLEPVRDHFTNDATAKALLEQVRQFKRDGNKKSSGKEIRRLNLVSLGKVNAGSHVVFAPLPSTSPKLEDSLKVLLQLKLSQSGEKSKVLFLPDWTARVCNKCEGDTKAIDAFFTVFLSSLKALDPKLMKDVIVIKQSEAILNDPSNYWISVINVGRYFALDDVMGANINDADGVGTVIGRLMKIADVMGLEPSSIGVTDCDDTTAETVLIERYFSETLETRLAKPTMLVADCPSLGLQKVENESHKTENFEYFILNDPKVHGKSKMKKAFCEPGNIDFCPPIDLAFAFGPDEIMINRSPDNGGDVTYKSKEEMETDFKSGSLHPGDLKASSTAIMVQVLEKLASTMKTDPDAAKASKALKAFQKKMSKKK